MFSSIYTKLNMFFPDAKPIDLTKLNDLVKENKLAEIKKALQQEKLIVKSGEWQEGNHFTSAIREAIALSRTEIVETFILAGYNTVGIVAKMEDQGSKDSLIYLAARSGCLPIVKLLVEYAEKNFFSNYAFDTVLNLGMKTAVFAGHAHLVDYFLNKNSDALQTSYGNYGSRKTYIIKALHDGNARVIETLLKHGDSLPQVIYLAHEKFSDHIRTAQTDAEQEQIKNTYAQTIKSLLDFGFGVDFPEECLTDDGKEFEGLTFLKGINIEGFNLLMSIEGCPITTEMLIKRDLKGAKKALVTISDLNDLNDEARREILKKRLFLKQKEQCSDEKMADVNLIPLWRAAEIGDLATVKIRLKANIDPNKVELRIRPSMINKLYKAGIGIDPDFREERPYHCPIVYAAMNGHEEIVELLRSNPRFNKKTIINAITAAQITKQTSLAEKLILSLDINQIPLIIDKFIERGFDINAQNMNGQTLLHIAFDQSDLEAVECLLARGSNIHLKDKSGRTPLYSCNLHLNSLISPVLTNIVMSYYCGFFSKPKTQSQKIASIQAEPCLLVENNGSFNRR